MQLSSSRSFTLLEILLVLAIIVSMSALITPWMFRKKPEVEWRAVLDELNNLISFARQESIATRKTYRLVFKLSRVGQDFIEVEREERDAEKPEKKIYKRVHSEYLTTKYIFPSQIKMVAFYQKSRENLFEKNKGSAYCHIISNGLVQDCIIHMTRKIDKVEEKGTFKIRPFLGTFEYYNGFLSYRDFEEMEGE
ncbi:hypothetical protein KAT08_02230 [Candidatus Babeliales bacterium]|nr:hypothetical protein [Candidatus Babeliales bacterium]